MSDDYTPTDASVRESFMYAQLSGRGLDTNQIGTSTTVNLSEKYDRWLSERDRQVAECAWDDGQGEGVVAAINHTPLPPNPYRTAEDAPHE